MLAYGSMTTKRDSSFSALERLRGQLPPGPTKSAPVEKPEKPGPARAVVRLERKHRRGKEVTIVDKLALPPAELERWCRELKQSLGCGGTVEDGAIVLQGDFRKRLPDALTALGVRAVTVAG
jgi:translation initiation factor 1